MFIDYCPYVLVSALLDSDTSRRHGYMPSGPVDAANEAPLAKTLGDFDRHCEHLFHQRAELYADWKKGLNQQMEADIYPWLYHPVGYLPLSGHSDGFSLVAFDALESYTQLGCASAKVVEDLSAHLCPNMETVREAVCEKLAGKQDKELARCLLRNVEEWYDGQGRDDGKTSPDNLPAAVRERPLLAFCRCKLDGLLSMDLAGWMVEAALPAMGHCVVQRMKEMQQKLSDNPEAVRGIYVQKDLDCIVTFLHSQGTHELGVLIHGTNLSVAGTLLSAIRELNLESLRGWTSYDGVRRIQEWVDDTRPLTRPGSEDAEKWDWALGDTYRLLAEHGAKGSHDMPLFRWTMTSASLAAAYQKEADNKTSVTLGWEKTRGWLELHAFLQVTPAGEGPAGVEAEHSNIEPANNEERPADNYFPHLLGLYDCLKTLREEGAKRAKHSLVWISKALEWLYLQQKKQDASFVGIQCVASVPIPACFKSSREDRQIRKEAAPYGAADLLARVRKYLLDDDVDLIKELKKRPTREKWVRLLGNAIAKDEAPPSPGSGIYRLLRRHFLDVIPRLYGLPPPLRQSISCLYQQYICAVTNVHTFDSVIDLLDAFATFHHVLCQILPRALLKERKLSITKVLSPEVAQRIARYASALHRALDHRTHRAYPESPLRDMAVDLRGDVYAFIQAAEAPLKCGVGLVACEHSIWAHGPRRRRDILGVFTQVGFTSGICAIYQNLGVEDRARLAYFDMDVPHLMHVGAYVDYLHESAHVALDTLVSHAKELREHAAEKKSKANQENAAKILPSKKHLETIDRLALLKAIDDTKTTRQRLEELFVHSLTYKLLCPGEPNLYLRFFISRFSVDAENAGYTALYSIHRFSEIFSVVFLGSYCLRKKSKGGGWKVRKVPADPRNKAFQKELASTLDEMLTWYGPYEHRKTPMEKKAIRDYVIEYVGAFLQDIQKPISSGDSAEVPSINDMLDLAMYAFASYAQRASKSVKESNLRNESLIEVANVYARTRERLFKIVSSHIRDGRAVHSYQFMDADQLDAMLVCGLLLHSYLEDLSDAEVKKNRKLKKGALARVNVDDLDDPLATGLDTGVPHHHFVLFQGNGSRVYLCPEKRRERLKRQLAVLRSFWSLSAVFKGRRFCDLIRFSGVLPRSQAAVSSSPA